MFEIRRYTPDAAREWNQFVDASRNATFLFRREYMDYHADRFHDCSWMAYKGNRLMALLPANLDDGMTLHSHQGLTYGGWILPPAHLDGAGLLDIFSEAVEVWRNMGISQLIYKPLPHIYAKSPSEEDLYALFRLGAQLIQADISSTAPLGEGVHFNSQQRRHLASALKAGAYVRELHGEDEIREFMAMLADCLAERHSAKPVHSPEEMLLLAGRFPGNIRFFGASTQDCGNASGDSGIDAGVCIYDTGIVAHAQYIATTPRGRVLNLLTPLFHHLMAETFANRRFFDFGISNEGHGRHLNAGLLRQKFSYGATATAHLRFHLPL